MGVNLQSVEGLDGGVSQVVEGKFAEDVGFFFWPGGLLGDLAPNRCHHEDSSVVRRTLHRGLQ